MCSVLQTSTIGNFHRKVDVQYQTCEMPKSSFFWSMAAMLHTTPFARMYSTHPRAMPLARLTMKTQIHKKFVCSHDGYGAPLKTTNYTRSLTALTRMYNCYVYIYMSSINHHYYNYYYYKNCGNHSSLL